NFFPMGPGYLTAALKRADCDVEVYAMDVFHYSNDELANHLDSFEYDLICCGFLAARFKETILGLSDVVNSHKKNAWFVLGGHGPSPIPEYVLKTTGADVVAIGEGELTIVDLARCKAGGGDLAQVKGIAYREGGTVRVNERNKPVRDLDALGSPAWDLFPMEKYTTCLRFPGMSAEDRAFPVLSNRGCINRCNFCYRLEKGIRGRSIPGIIEEMEKLQERYGVTYFFFIDELFVSSKKRVRDFGKALKESGIKAMLNLESRVDVFDEEIAEILKEIGCVFINIGFESTSQRVLDRMHKNVTVEQNYRTAEIAGSMGIGLGLNCIWGEPGDDEHSLRSNVDFIMKYNLYDQIRTIRPVTPYPGCDLYYDAISMGLLKGPEEFFERFVNSDLLTVNFTGIPDKRCYELLLDANRRLITDHFQHTSKDMEAAENLIEKFRQLYAGEITSFRGARSDDTLEHKRKTL
ncbi:MAG: radical SAM protein, partial [Syntrophorhabdaceae bacterium]|nr:radical SAM protein [Syntrophorhabdaceae bacterium]